MKKLRFKKLDAFATGQSEGNPAGCIFLDKLSELSANEMLQIARELKGFVSEVGYVVPVSENEFGFKYYSSERELDFCGHVTIATMYDIIRTSESTASDKYQINTNRGTLMVENRIKSEDSVFIMSPEPVENQNVPDVTEIASKLRINTSDINANLPVSIVNAGLETLIVPIASLDSILAIQPDLNELNEFCYKSGVDIIEVYTPDVYEKTNNYRTRVFAPTFGYIEDPATGSGNSAFGYYLINNKLWEEGTISIEQNGKWEQYNVVKLQKQLDKNNNQRVWFGGGAVKRIEGDYIIYD